MGLEFAKYFSSKYAKSRKASIKRTSTQSFSPLGLGILYSVEFNFGYVGPKKVTNENFQYQGMQKKEIDMTYIGITAQVNPKERFKEHASGAAEMYKKMGDNPFYEMSVISNNSNKTEDKLMYIALGSAMAANDQITKTTIENKVIKIINVVSLFDLAEMERMYISAQHYNTQYKGPVIKRPFDLIKNDVSQLNTDPGGGGSLEVQDVAVNKLEWLYAAYYYIIEKDPSVTFSRKKSLFNHKDPLEVNIFKVINQYQGDTRYKIPYISNEEIIEFINRTDIKSDRQIVLTADREIDYATIYKGSDLALEIATFVMTDNKAVDLSERSMRNLTEEFILRNINNKSASSQDLMSFKLKITGEESLKIKKNDLSKAQNNAVRKTELALRSILPKLVEEFGSRGIDGALSLLEQKIKSEGYSYQFSSNFKDAFKGNHFKDHPKAIQILLKNVIEILTENLYDNLFELSAKAGNLGKSLKEKGDVEKEIKQALGISKNQEDIYGKTVRIFFTSKLEKNAYDKDTEAVAAAYFRDTNPGNGRGIAASRIQKSSFNNK